LTYHKVFPNCTFISLEYPNKRPKYEKATSHVAAYSNENIPNNAFLTLRAKRVQNIIDKPVPSILFASPPFTGKTSLCSTLLYQKLVSLGEKVREVNFGEWRPWDKPLEKFWQQTTGFNFAKTMECAKRGDRIFFLLDEFQITYFTSKEELLLVYPTISENDAYKISLDLRDFHNMFKIIKVNNIRIRCFSAYGDPTIKPGTLLSTPYTFEEKISDHSKFDLEEYNELCDDFVKRTKIHFIKTGGNFPKEIVDYIWKMTDGHVGYTSAILWNADQNAIKIQDSKTFMSHLRSDALLEVLKSQRSAPDFFNFGKVSESELKDFQEALKQIWSHGTLPLAYNNKFEQLARWGWISFDSKTQSVSLHCPLSKQLLLMSMYKNILPPPTDSFKHVADLMNHFLSSLNGNWLQNTMSVLQKDQKTLLEAMWQKEFYRIGTQTLASGTIISVEVTKGIIDGEEFTIKGKIDFYINGPRQWAVEFLIRGDSAGAAEEHSGRFDDKYKNLPWKECLLVDFRASSANTADFCKQAENTQKKLPRILSPTFLPNYWIVIFDSDNYDKLEVVKYDEHAKLIKSEIFQLLKTN